MTNYRDLEEPPEEGARFPDRTHPDYEPSDDELRGNEDYEPSDCEIGRAEDGYLKTITGKEI